MQITKRTRATHGGIFDWHWKKTLWIAYENKFKIVKKKIVCISQKNIDIIIQYYTIIANNY